MSDTPIVDRAKKHNPIATGADAVEWFNCVPIETARQLERMCAELAELLDLRAGDERSDEEQAALARWQAMKDGK